MSCLLVWEDSTPLLVLDLTVSRRTLGRGMAHLDHVPFWGQWGMRKIPEMAIS